MRSGKPGLISALAVLCLAGWAVPANAQPRHQLFHLYHTLWELRDAEKELRESGYQFGEHKARALVAMELSIRQIEVLLRNTGDIRGIPSRQDFREEYRRYPNHPHLYHAVVELRLAHNEVLAIRHNFGGHRDAALRDMDAAIVQIELCLKNARR